MRLGNEAQTTETMKLPHWAWMADRQQQLLDPATASRVIPETCLKIRETRDPPTAYLRY